MSAVTLQRFLVTGHDHDLWQVVVEAPNRIDAINKAQNIYTMDGFRNTGAFDLCSSYVDWMAEPLNQEGGR